MWTRSATRSFERPASVSCITLIAGTHDEIAGMSSLLTADAREASLSLEGRRAARRPSWRLVANLLAVLCAITTVACSGGGGGGGSSTPVASPNTTPPPTTEQFQVAH